MKAVELRDLRVVYRNKAGGDRVALDGFSLEADHEMVALLGPNGSGKSTLMGVIAQTLTPESGQRLAPTSRKELSVVFQTPALDLLLTVRENLMIAGALHGLSRALTAQRIGELCGELGVGDRLDEQVRHLSGGLMRRVDLARALVPHPRVLLLDEPTTGLDIDARRSFWEVLARIRSRLTMTVILATHLIDEAEHADTVVMMRDGRRVRAGSPQSLRGLLGSRVLRLRLPRDGDVSVVTAWLRDSGVEHIVNEGLILGIDVDPDLAARCPVEDASVTIAPPSLEDVYSFFAGSRVDAPASEEIPA